MSESKQRFLNEVAAPLEDNAELQIAAVREVEEWLSEGVADSDFDAAADKLRTAPGSRWRWILATVVLAVSILILLLPGTKWLQGLRVMDVSIRGIGENFSDTSFLQRSMTPEQRLLVFGEPGHVDEVSRWRPLWESDPNNPAYFIDYVLAYEVDRGAPPADFLQTGEEIDPANGWFRLKSAVMDVDSIVEKTKGKAGGYKARQQARREGKAGEWEILDETKFAERIALIKEAASRARVTSYQSDLLKQRSALLPTPRDFSESVQVIAHQAASRFDRSHLDLRDLLGAEAQRCRLENDREGFRELAETWDRLTLNLTRDGETVIEGLIAQSVFATTLPPMRDAAIALDVEADKWTGLEARFRKRSNLLTDRRRDVASELDELVERHGSMMASLTLPMMERQLIDPPELTKEDLLAGCRVDQALIGRLAMVAGWVILGLSCLIGLGESKWRSPLLRRLQQSLGRGLGRSDLLWVILGGVLGPIALFMLLRYATPLARLDWGPRRTLYMVPLSHFVGLLLMLWVWPVAIADQRLGCGLKVFPWTSNPTWRIAAMLAPVVGMIVIGLSLPIGGHTMPVFIAGCVCGGFSLIWLLARSSMFGSPKRRVRLGVVGEAARPAWLVSMLILSLLTFFFHAEERRWLARDEVTTPGMGMSRYEDRNARQLWLEIREVMDLD